MINKNKYYFVILLIIITRILDGITTYMVTPDLKQELNPLVSQLGLNWFVMILLGVLFVIISIYCFTFGYKNQKK